MNNIPDIIMAVTSFISLLILIYVTVQKNEDDKRFKMIMRGLIISNLIVQGDSTGNLSKWKKHFDGELSDMFKF